MFDPTHERESDRMAAPPAGHLASHAEAPEVDRRPAGDKKKAKGENKVQADKEPKKVYEAGGVIVFDGKVVLRFTDGQNWIFPKGKLKKRERPEDAAIREAVEETGLKVEIVGEAGECIMKAEGKKRRFVFYLMRAVGTTWDWPHHEGRDTFVMDADRVGALVHKWYRELWECVEPRARALIAAEAGKAHSESRPEDPSSPVDPSPYPLPDSGRG